MTLRDRFRKQQGFTLPELLVVVVILSILMAIAIPSFLGSRRDGQDSQAQSALRAALAAERTYYVDHQEYTTDSNTLRGLEPNLTWTTTDATQEGAMVAIGGSDNQVVVIVSTAASGNQFCIMNVAADQGTAVNGQTLAGTYYLRNPSQVTTPPTAVTTAQCGTTGYTRDVNAGWATS